MSGRRTRFLDECLGLPAGVFSYVLEDWAQRFYLKGSFAEAAESLETVLGLRLGSRTLEHMSQGLAGFVVPFRDAIEPPPAAEEGPNLVVTADGKGVPMRRPVAEGPPAPSLPHQGGEGQQEADGMRRGGLLDRAVRAKCRRPPRD